MWWRVLVFLVLLPFILSQESSLLTTCLAKLRTATSARPLLKTHFDVAAAAGRVDELMAFLQREVSFSSF